MKLVFHFILTEISPVQRPQSSSYVAPSLRLLEFCASGSQSQRRPTETPCRVPPERQQHAHYIWHNSDANKTQNRHIDPSSRCIQMSTLVFIIWRERFELLAFNRSNDRLRRMLMMCVRASYRREHHYTKTQTAKKRQNQNQNQNAETFSTNVSIHRHGFQVPDVMACRAVSEQPQLRARNMRGKYD